MNNKINQKEIINLHKADLYQLKYNKRKVKLIEISHNKSEKSLSYVISIDFENIITLRHSEEVEFCEELHEFIPAFKQYDPYEVELRYTNTIPFTENMTLEHIFQLDNFLGAVLKGLNPDNSFNSLYEYIYELESIFYFKSNPKKLKTNCNIIPQLDQNWNLGFYW